MNHISEEPHLEPLRDIPERDADWYEAACAECTKDMPPGFARLSRISTAIKDGYVPYDADLRFLGEALGRIVARCDIKKSLGIGGRQCQGRRARPSGEIYRRKEIATRVILLMHGGSKKDDAIGRIADALELERGPRRGRRVTLDPSHQGWRNCVEECYEELGEQERTLIRDEMLEDDFFAPVAQEWLSQSPGK